MIYLKALLNKKKWSQIYSTFAKRHGNQCEHWCLCDNPKKNDLQIYVAHYCLSIHLIAVVKQLNHTNLKKY